MPLRIEESADVDSRATIGDGTVIWHLAQIRESAEIGEECIIGRGAYIDQSQSLNLFMESPSIGKLSSMYMHAWKSGLKTTYYLRSRPATRINQTTTGSDGAGPDGPPTDGATEPSPFTD